MCKHIVDVLIAKIVWTTGFSEVSVQVPNDVGLPHTVSIKCPDASGRVGQLLHLREQNRVVRRKGFMGDRKLPGAYHPLECIYLTKKFVNYYYDDPLFWRYPVFSKSSRPISMRRISLVPAPIS